MLDSFSEQIVKQSMDAKRILVVLGAVVLAVALCAAAAVWFVWLFFPVAALCGFGVYWVASSQSWEVEYAVTNGDIDIDRIIARRERKTIVRVRGEKIESLMPLSRVPRSQKFDRIVMAARSPKTATWCFTYHSKKGSTLVLFEPNADVLDALCRGLSRAVCVETNRALREL